MTTFYLGTDMPNWLWEADVRVPLFVSRRRVERYKTLRPSTHPWALDSRGFTELSTTGVWSLSPERYADIVRRCREEVGKLVFAAPQDWMCEPKVLQATGLSVPEHQRRTVDNFLRLRSVAPDLPFIPVLQGWTLEDYLRCIDLYSQAGVDLREERTVGIGSVCRRQSVKEGAAILRAIAAQAPGVRLHGFGVKVNGLRAVGGILASCDSMAWSFQARKKNIRLPGCPHQRCSSCKKWALLWRSRVLASLPSPEDSQQIDP